ncbi:MAG: hypothetical protein M3Q66_10550 [Chloroflexota bacterium]|nr:hypothetical protein [Chloroflexota bacterium]
MNRHAVRMIALAILTLSTAACASAAVPTNSSPVPASPSPVPATFEQSQAALCDSFGSMLRAVGNPDAGTPSVLSKALDDAVVAKDGAAADRAATAVLAELETGRRQAAESGRYEPARPVAAAMDRILRVFEVYVQAKRAQAANAPGAVDPQAALEQAGGAEAWPLMLMALRANPIPSGATPLPCKAFSGTP